MIAALSREVVSDTARGEPLWFHPRACAVPRPAGSLLVMTAQSISGSDVFGPVHWMTSADGDAVPEYHAPTGTVLVLGFNVYYRDNVLASPNEADAITTA